MTTETTLAVRWFRAVLGRPGRAAGGALLLAAAGAAAFAALPRDLFPDLALPTVQVLFQNPGRSAAELELTVAQPVELALAGVPGVVRVRSVVQPGVVQVIVGFEDGVGWWRSRQLVGERLAAVAGELPEGTSAPLLTSAAGRLQEIQELVLQGPAIDPMALRDHTVRVLVPRLQSVPGVARVEVLGGEVRQLQVTVSPESMRVAGVSLEQIVDALEGSELDASAGVLEIQDKLWYVTLGTLAATPAEVRRLPVHTAFGLVALGDVAEVREAPELRMGLARYQGFEAVSMRVVKQPTAETLATARRVREALPALRATLPEGMALDLFYDQGGLVEHALGGVTRALLIGAVLVAAVLVLLLGNLRAAAMVVVLLPLATFGAAVPLWLLGQGLNAMTLGGLAIAVGLLVDSGVILVENLLHRLREAPAGAGVAARRRTAAAAAAEVAAPITVAVMVVLTVFLPLLALGGIAGRLYAPLSLAVASALAVSLVLTFTLLPVLVDRGIPPGARLEDPPIVRFLQRLYRPLLAVALRRRAAVLIAAAALSAAGIAAALRLDSDFLPALDEGAVMVQTLLPSDTSLAAVDAANRRLEQALDHLPGVAAHYRRTGRGELTEDPMPHYLSDVLVILEPGARAEEVAAEVAEVAERMPFGVEITTPMDMRISEGIGGTPADVLVELYNPSLDELGERQSELEALLAAVPGVVSVNADTGRPLPSWQVIPDDDALRRLDVPRPLLAETVRAALQGLALAPRFEGPQRIERAVRFPQDGRLTPETLKRLPLVVEEGKVVELGQVARVEESVTPAMIRRRDGQRRLGFQVRTEGDLERTAGRIEEALAAADLPAGTTVGLSGRIEEARETRRRLLTASAVALALVVVLLGAVLGRARDVVAVLLTLPTALAGGLLALAWAGETWNASSIVGAIGLLGIAVQNSLVLIVQIRERRRAGRDLLAAVAEASIGRMRPKLMTAGASILGLAPMLFGFGGSELERPLAVVVVGGLVTSTLFTLLVLPALYSLIAGGGPISGDGAAEPGSELRST
jgi:cobalt-zinc-cadmium resistance protein CzcA